MILKILTKLISHPSYLIFRHPREGEDPFKYGNDEQSVISIFRIILFAALVFFAGVGLGMFIIIGKPSTETLFLPPVAIHHLKQGILWMDTVSRDPFQPIFLFWVNLKVLFKVFLGGLVFGIGGLFFLFYNGVFAVGVPLEVCIQHGFGERFLRFMLAHGLLELVPIWMATALGMKMGMSILFETLFPGLYQKRIWIRKEQGRQTDRHSVLFQLNRYNIVRTFSLLFSCIPLLGLAAIIEYYISLNPHTPFWLRFGVMLLSIPFLYFYLKYVLSFISCPLKDDGH